MAYDGEVIIKIDGDSSNFKKELDGLGKAAGIAGKAIVTGMAAATTALAGIGAAAAKVGAEYETSLAKVSTIADTSVKSLGALGGEVLKLSGDTGTAATELNEALYSAISAGADTAHATELVAVAAKAARGGFTDTETAVDGLTSALNAYGMQTTDAQGLANKFLVTQNLGKTTFGELAGSIGTVAPTAKAANVSVDDLLASVASLTANGIGTSEAMTGMKAALANVIKPTKDAADMAESLGLDFSAAALAGKGWTGFLEDIKSKTGGSTEKMSALFGSVEALNTVLTLTSDQGMSLMDKTLAEMKTNTTALDDAYNKMSDTTEVSMGKIGNSLKNIGIEVCDNFKEPMADALQDISRETDNLYKTMSSPKVKASLKTLADGVASIAKKGTELAAQALPKLVKGFAYLVDHGEQVATALKVAAAAVVTFKAAAVLDKASASFKAASVAVTAYTAAQGAATTALTLGQTVVGVMTGKIGLAAAAQAAWNAVTAANPFVLTALAIGGLVTAISIYNASQEQEISQAQRRIDKNKELQQEYESSMAEYDQLRDARSESIALADNEIGAVERYVGSLRGCVDENGRVMDGYEDRAAYLSEQINNLVPDAVKWNENEAGSYVEISKSIDELIAKKKKEAYANAYQADYEAALKDVGAAQTNAITLQEEASRAANANEAAQTKLLDVTRRFHEEAAMVGEGYVDQGLQDALSEATQKAEEAQTALDGCNQQAENAQSKFEYLTGVITNMNALDMAQKPEEIAAATAVIAATSAELANHLQNSAGEIKAQYEVMSDARNQAVAKLNDPSLTEAERQTWEGLAQAAQSGTETLAKEYDLAGGAMIDSMTKSVNAGKSAVHDACLGAAREAGQGYQEGIALQSASAEDQTKKFKAVCDAALKGDTTEQGKNYMVGFLQAIIDTDPAPNVKTMAQKSLDALNAGIDAHSPSKKTRQSGVYFSEGMALGIEDGKSGVINAAVRVAQAGIKAAKDTLQIKSPSRVMREQVGRMMAQGMALGIEDGAPAVKSAIALLSHMALENAKDAGGSFKDIGKAYMNELTYGVESGRDKSLRAMEKAVKADADAYKKKVDAETDTLVKAKQKQMDKTSKVRKEALQKEIDTIKSDAADKKKAHEDAGKEVTDAYSSALKDGYDEALTIVKTRVDELTSEFESAQSDILKRQAEMQNKLSGFGDLFTVDESGYLSLGDIDKNIDALSRYDEALSSLAERGVSDEFMQQVTALGVEEGTKFAQKLAKLPEGAFEKYMGAWQEQQDLAKTVSEKFYADQLETLKADFAEKLDKELENVPTLLTGLGQDSIQGMINGMYSKDGALSAAAAQIVRNAISAMQAAADIHSPSRKTRDMIGKPLAAGVGVGFEAEMAKVYRRISGTLGGEVARMSADVKLQADRHVAAESRRGEVQTHFQREIIEKTPTLNVGGDMAGLVRYMYPYIKMEEKRRGGSMIKGET